MSEYDNESVRDGHDALVLQIEEAAYEQEQMLKKRIAELEAELGRRDFDEAARDLTAAELARHRRHLGKAEQRIEALEAERAAIADTVSGAGIDGGLLQWRVKTLVAQRRVLAQAIMQWHAGRGLPVSAVSLAKSALEEEVKHDS